CPGCGIMCCICWRAMGFFFSSRRRHTRSKRDWSSDVCSSDLEISQHIPVVIATHNNTIGVSVHPDYIIYTSKEILSDGSVKYHVYSGHPSSAELIDLEGNTISRRSVLLDCLEAGEPAYIDRRISYEILNN